MNTTPEQRAEWAKLDKEATPGPWEDVRETPYLDVMHGAYGTPVVMRDRGIMRDQDCELIAAYRSAVPSLIADVEELLEKFAGEEKVSDELGEMAGKYQHDWETAQAQVERLTAQLAEADSETKRLQALYETNTERLTALLRETASLLFENDLGDEPCCDISDSWKSEPHTADSVLGRIEKELEGK